ncbi:UDP-N-acetylmuramate dehydrogenase [Atopobium fossor]|uniref:UDP-N-acetylmuramate dehydrogenase n=1 Tax=Atopobium fossor TaxID=39487 RepID=UPI000400E750|nr:UDP-N-acetylmuramate dehydrogenase [Atopobium fossor]
MSDLDNDKPSLAERLVSIAGEDNVYFDEPMSEHTTFAIGGPADMYVVPDTLDRVRVLIDTCREFGAHCFVLGRGSDVLVSDKGYRGVIIGMADALDDLTVEGERVIAQAGVCLSDAAEMACALSLTGMEFACGIPGTVGGAAFMNAGAYDGCMADIIESARVLTPEGKIITLSNEELDLGYRSSRISKEGLVVLEVTYLLHEGNESEIRAKMDDFTQRRESKQPLELPSAGSTFKRPEGYFAGKLIMDAGLQGYRVGGAEVSTKHAGFVVNIDHATAADVHSVIQHVQDEVMRQFGVCLEPEVRFLGE